MDDVGADRDKRTHRHANWHRSPYSYSDRYTPTNYKAYKHTHSDTIAHQHTFAHQDPDTQAGCDY